MHGSVVILFDPVRELLIELVNRRQLEIANQELIANSSKEAFDLSPGSRIADCRVT